MSFDPELALGELHSLILEDMRRATSSDMAADGPIGDEEKGVWDRIERLAREQRDRMQGLQSRVEDATFAAPLVISRHLTEKPSTVEWRLTLNGQTVSFGFFGTERTTTEVLRELLGMPA